MTRRTIARSCLLLGAAGLRKRAGVPELSVRVQLAVDRCAVRCAEWNRLEWSSATSDADDKFASISPALQLEHTVLRATGSERTS